MDQKDQAETQSEDQQTKAAETPPARSFETVLKGIVDVVYSDEDKDFGFIVRKNQKFYFDPRFVAAEERPKRGDRVFFVARPPLQEGAKPVAACVLVKDKPAVGTVVNLLPNGKSGFLQVTDELDNHFNIYVPIPARLGEVSVGERLRFVADENPQGPFARGPKRLE